MPFIETASQKKYAINGGRAHADVTVKNNGEKYVQIKADIIGLNIEFTLDNAQSINEVEVHISEKISDLTMLLDLIREVNIFKG